MQTKNYAIDLMLPGQINKDVLFNEAISKITSFTNIAVRRFIKEIPTSLEEVAIYIISEGEYKNYLCYQPTQTSGWQLTPPNKFMVFFVIESKGFYYYTGDAWQAIKGV